MNKTLCKVITAALLGASLCTIGTAVMPSVPVQASIEEDGLKNQDIYYEGDYIIAKEKASSRALSIGVWIEFNGCDNLQHRAGYAAPKNVGTIDYEDGTTVTVEKADEGYLITFKMPKNIFYNLGEVKAMFITYDGPHCRTYVDGNGGHWYTL